MEPQRYDPAEFARYALAHWKTITGSIALAGALAAAASLLLPKQYTATASLVVELPAGSDPRAAAALSPVYLESLRTYEHFASSDTIFFEAIDRLGIRSRLRGRSIESLKSSVLRISKPASTRVLEISATLDDAVTAQRLAQYLAERTVELNRTIVTRSTGDLVTEAEAALRGAAARLDQANRAREEFSRTSRMQPVKSDIENLTELRFDLQRDAQQARAGLEEFKARNGTDSQSAREIAGNEARIAAMDRQDKELEKEIQQNAAALNDLEEKNQALDAERESARAETEAARRRLNEVRSAAPYQGERLSVLDPGIVPERPTFPNLTLNVAGAVMLSAVGCLFWIALRFGFERSKTHAVETRTVATRERAQGVYSIGD